jgi:hypothetical protein
MTAPGTRRPSRAPRLCEIAHQVFVEGAPTSQSEAFVRWKATRTSCTEGRPAGSKRPSARAFGIAASSSVRTAAASGAATSAEAVWAAIPRASHDPRRADHGRCTGSATPGQQSEERPPAPPDRGRARRRTSRGGCGTGRPVPRAAGALRPAVPPDDVLADHPDLARSVALGIAPAALAKLDAQPTSYRQLGTETPAPRTLTELKRTLEAGVALTRFSETDPWPLHLVVRRVQANAFVVSEPVGADQSLAQRYAEGLWHHYEPASRYTFGPRGFDTALKNGRTVSYRYGHLPLEQPCPAADQIILSGVSRQTFAYPPFGNDERSSCRSTQPRSSRWNYPPHRLSVSIDAVTVEDFNRGLHEATIRLDPRPNDMRRIGIATAEANGEPRSWRRHGRVHGEDRGKDRSISSPAPRGETPFH